MAHLPTGPPHRQGPFLNQPPQRRRGGGGRRIDDALKPVCR